MAVCDWRCQAYKSGSAMMTDFVVLYRINGLFNNWKHWCNVFWTFTGPSAPSVFRAGSASRQWAVIAGTMDSICVCVCVWEWGRVFQLVCCNICNGNAMARLQQNIFRLWTRARRLSLSSPLSPSSLFILLRFTFKGNVPYHSDCLLSKCPVCAKPAKGKCYAIGGQKIHQGALDLSYTPLSDEIMAISPPFVRELFFFFVVLIIHPLLSTVFFLFAIFIWMTVCIYLVRSPYLFFFSLSFLDIYTYITYRSTCFLSPHNARYFSFTPA